VLLADDVLDPLGQGNQVDIDPETWLQALVLARMSPPRGTHQEHRRPSATHIEVTTGASLRQAIARPAVSQPIVAQPGGGTTSVLTMDRRGSD
jgi:hypothetical protein